MAGEVYSLKLTNQTKIAQVSTVSRATTEGEADDELVPVSEHRGEIAVLTCMTIMVLLPEDTLLLPVLFVAAVGVAVIIYRERRIRQQ